jgi:5-formyltetrahydrofolate cyclo-ligase
MSQQTKVWLRREFLERRRALVPEQVAVLSGGIVARALVLLTSQQHPVLLCYVASKDNEVETRELLAWALGAGTTVLVPVGLPGRALAWSVLEDFDSLVRTAFGIWEPPEAAREMVVPREDAPVIVPGIAFDREGYRLGYGGGYYDRFLAHHRGLKIGLAYDCQIADQLPHEIHDVPMNYIATESRLLECRAATDQHS